MTVRIQKPAVNIREKLAELERPIGINGQALMATDTPQQAFDLLGARNRNRVINGDCRIDQRNAGASVNSNGAFIVDRFQQLMSGGGVLTSQRSTTVPAGFTNSIFTQVTTADSSIAAGDYYLLRHTVEGFNTADLGWGAANALSVTLSFWVRSSVIGTFSGAVENAAETRSYPFTYAISSVNTWEKKTITIPGDTSGTWATDNTVGIYLNLDLGSGSTFQGTASAWGSAKAFAATGAVQLISTLNATFYITGVQLESGKVATPFEYRSYGQELALCQRYYYRLTPGAVGRLFSNGFSETTTVFNSLVFFPVTMRTEPTSLEQSGTASHYEIYNGSNTNLSTVPTFFNATTQSAATRATVASGLTAAQSGSLRSTNSTAYLGWSAEL
jgi:hypothetical protein